MALCALRFRDHGWMCYFRLKNLRIHAFQSIVIGGIQGFLPLRHIGNLIEMRAL